VTPEKKCGYSITISVVWQCMVAFGIVTKQVLRGVKVEGTPSAYFFCDCFVTTSELIYAYAFICWS